MSLTNKSLLNDEAFSFNKSPDLTSDDERWLSTVLNAASGSIVTKIKEAKETRTTNLNN